MYCVPCFQEPFEQADCSGWSIGDARELFLNDCRMMKEKDSAWDYTHDLPIFAWNQVSSNQWSLLIWSHSTVCLIISPLEQGGSLIFLIRNKNTWERESGFISGGKFPTAACDGSSDYITALLYYVPQKNVVHFANITRHFCNFTSLPREYQRHFCNFAEVHFTSWI